MAVEFPELGSEESLNALLAELNDMIDPAFAGLRHPLPPATAASAAAALAEQEKYRISAHARMAIAILLREIELNLHTKKPEQASISVTTTGGAAIVNVGVIHGNVEQVIGRVNDAGHHELAELLEQLAGAIKQAEVLGDDRTGYLEQVQFIAEQAAEPERTRKPGLVIGMFRGLQVGLQSVANLAQIAALLGPALAQHFGFGWPL